MVIIPIILATVVLWLNIIWEASKPIIMAMEVVICTIIII